MKDDTISRAAALDFIDSMNWCDEISDEAFKKITIHLENLPSAQPEYERVSADDVAVSIAPTKLASAVWLYGTLTELEKAGYVICRKMT